MTIREATEREIPAIVELLRGFRRESGREIGVAEAGRLERVIGEAIAAAGCRLLVSTEGERLQGYLAMHLTPFPLRCGHEAYISDLVVERSARGTGVGSALLARAEELAGEQGCVRMMLNTGKTSEAYRREFYPKQGFEERTGFANFVKTLDSGHPGPGRAERRAPERWQDPL